MSLKQTLFRNFNNPQMLALIVILLIIGLIIYFFGGILAPVFLAILLAYLINFPLKYLVSKGIKRWVALLLLFSLIFIVITLIFTFAIPLIIRQLNGLVNEMPNIVAAVKIQLQNLQTYLSPYVSEKFMFQIYENMHQYILSNFDVRIDNILAVVSNVVYILVNVFLVPFLALLLLTDYVNLKKTISAYLPEKRELASGVFTEFMGQLDNYVKGKVIEFIIMTILSFITFSFFGLKYNLIISLVYGLSVIVPFVGIIIATIPLLSVAFFQFDLTSTFWIICAVHTALQIFNGNLLVPYLYSKANNLRPFTILVAVLVFGQIWGIVGVFLAIPLATLIKALGNAWLINSQIYKEVHGSSEEDSSKPQKKASSPLANFKFKKTPVNTRKSRDSNGKANTSKGKGMANSPSKPSSLPSNPASTTETAASTTKSSTSREETKEDANDGLGA